MHLLKIQLCLCVLMNRNLSHLTGCVMDGRTVMMDQMSPLLMQDALVS